MRPHLEDEGGLDGQRLLVAQVFEQLLHFLGAAEGLEGGVQIVQSCKTAAMFRVQGIVLNGRLGFRVYIYLNKLSQGFQGQVY